MFEFTVSFDNAIMYLKIKENYELGEVTFRRCDLLDAILAVDTLLYTIKLNQNNIGDLFFLKLDSKYSFEDRYEYMFISTKKSYDSIAVDFQNDFVNKSVDVIINLVLSFFNQTNHEYNSDLFILVNNDVLSSNEYQSFRKEFSHILHSIVKIGNEFMLLFKLVFFKKNG